MAKDDDDQGGTWVPATALGTLPRGRYVVLDQRRELIVSTTGCRFEDVWLVRRL